MGHTQNADQVRRYIPCLEGIRGYCFLVVFCTHYLLPKRLAHPGTIRLQIFQVLDSLAFFAVPIFFVLSGFLIGGILYDTRNKEGYFRVFYYRRILRVFPVYYLALAAIACFGVIRGMNFVADYHFWAHLLYIHNLFPSYPNTTHVPGMSLVHFWSLAVEEQFYMFWPLVVWLLPDRQKLTALVISLIGLCCCVRLALPLVGTAPVQFIYFFTPTRVDGILLGVLLALVRRTEVFERLKPFAKWVALSGVLSMMMVALRRDAWVWSLTYWGEEISILVANIAAFAIIVLVLEEKSLLNRACSLRSMCWLGSMSYGLYVFHFIFAPFFMGPLTSQLALHMRESFAVLTSSALAFALTLLLSILSYRLIEMPIMKLKRHIQYGAVKPLTVSLGAGPRVLASAGD
jgi:peptidoglycan/LPS O-acetylase OafA/YrhL